MENGALLMTQKDRDRLVALKRAKWKLITQRQAAEELQVSERQALNGPQKFNPWSCSLLFQAIFMMQAARNRCRYSSVTVRRSVGNTPLSPNVFPRGSNVSAQPTS